jgi:ABC-2 type transport system permease protein
MDAVPVNFSGISLQEGEEHGNEVFDRHDGQLFDRFAEQQRVLTLAGVAAPLLPVRALSMALAGTDVAHHRAFVGSAEAYRRSIQRVMNADITQHSRPGVVYTAGADLWARVPEFRYDPPGLKTVLAQQGASLLVLGAWLIAACWFAARSVSRLAVD